MAPRLEGFYCSLVEVYELIQWNDILIIIFLAKELLEKTEEVFMTESFSQKMLSTLVPLKIPLLLWKGMRQSGLIYGHETIHVIPLA